MEVEVEMTVTISGFREEVLVVLEDEEDDDVEMGHFGELSGIGACSLIRCKQAKQFRF